MKKTNRFLFLLPWFICTLGALFYAYEYFLRITPSVMTSELMRYYHIDDGTLGNLSAYYYYIYTPMQLVVGILMDRYGPRRLLTMATISCVFGTILFAMTPYLGVAEIGRFLIGFGSAFAFVGVLKLATIWLPRKYFGLFSGLATALGMLGAIAGDVALSHLVSLIGWQNTVFVSGGFGVVLAILLGVFVRDKNILRKHKMSEPQEPTTLSSVIEGLMIIIRSPQMWVVGLIGGLLYIPTSAFAELWGIPYLQQVHHMTNEHAAWAISMIFAGWVFGGPINGLISDRLNQRRLPLSVGPLVAAVLIMLVIYIPGIPDYAVFALLFIFGVFSGAQPLVFAVGRELSPNRAAGTAISFVNMMVMISGVIFQPLIGVILDLRWHGQMQAGIRLFGPDDYMLALAILPIGLLLASLLSRFVLKETHCQPSDNGELRKELQNTSSNSESLSLKGQSA